jgi:hypothetical protein
VFYVYFRTASAHVPVLWSRQKDEKIHGSMPEISAKPAYSLPTASLKGPGNLSRGLRSVAARHTQRLNSCADVSLVPTHLLLHCDEKVLLPTDDTTRAHDAQPCNSLARIPPVA